ncbi:MAG: four helix bundle protein [Algoriphagus sp.]|uniref:four helix bundle protein n=1 Tax=Algoriphagus sp. TaxID=1872435 RepID=UPI0026313D8C|nr:four helix bundle protein [Algoriphagus sp.]MDG1276043.1 four helix bundle protein [Algoriphagus sp.]
MEFKDLLAFKKGFQLAMKIYEASKSFPTEEKYSLIDQIRRSSRSTCANIGEGYRKRKYPAHFISKLSDADMENTETQVWIEFSFSCGYISESIKTEWDRDSIEIGKLIGYMMANPEKFGSKSI